MMYINEYWVISFCFTNAGNLQNEYQKRYFVMMMLLFLHFCIANLSLITVLRKDDIFVWTVMNFSSLWPNHTDVTCNKVLLLSDDIRNAIIEMWSLLCFMYRQKLSAIFALKTAITKEHNSYLHACLATRFTNVWTNDNYLTTKVFVNVSCPYGLLYMTISCQSIHNLYVRDWIFRINEILREKRQT